MNTALVMANLVSAAVMTTAGNSGLSTLLLNGGGYTGPITALKDILITIAGAVGVILGVYGGIKFAMAFKNHDNQGEQSAIYTLVAAGILIGLSVIVPLITK
ncbi:MAG: hypothetical protein IJI65_00870 [Lachnospiraceae bacterium]|nr:hypothetical protein [Lachnospiraceae bacterium]